MPRENVLPRFFSRTTQCSSAPFTRRVSAASPDGTKTQPAGTESVLPSAHRTVVGLRPGEQILEVLRDVGNVRAACRES